MIRHPRQVMFVSVAAITLALSSLRAQVPDPLVATQAPVPGSGHHYIGVGAETVNPADGSLTFDLPIKTPEGRQLTMPFGIRYSSTEQYFLTNGHGRMAPVSTRLPNLNEGATGPSLLGTGDDSTMMEM